MWILIKWIGIVFMALVGIVGAMAGVVQVMTEHSPDEVSASLNKWVPGISNYTPSFLLDQTTRLWIFWFSLALILLIGGVWLLRRHRSSKIAAIPTVARPQNLAVHSVAKPHERDASLLEGLSYIGDRKWGGNFTDQIYGGKSESGDSINRMKKFRQAAVDGAIRVWGKLNKYAPWVEIRPDYWETWQLDYMAFVRGESATEKALNLSPYSDSYQDLWVSTGEFEAKWPPAQESLDSKKKNDKAAVEIHSLISDLKSLSNSITHENTQQIEDAYQKIFATIQPRMENLISLPMILSAVSPIAANALARAGDSQAMSKIRKTIDGRVACLQKVQDRL